MKFVFSISFCMFLILSSIGFLKTAYMLTNPPASIMVFASDTFVLTAHDDIYLIFHNGKILYSDSFIINGFSLFFL